MNRRADLESAVSALDEIGIPEDIPVSYSMDWQEQARQALRDLVTRVERLAAAATAAPVRTSHAVTFAGGQNRVVTVWAERLAENDVGPHWAALDDALFARQQLLRGLGTAIRITTRIAAVLTLASNPVGAIWAAAQLARSIDDVLRTVPPQSS